MRDANTEPFRREVKRGTIPLILGGSMLLFGALGAAVDEADLLESDHEQAHAELDTTAGDANLDGLILGFVIGASGATIGIEIYQAPLRRRESGDVGSEPVDL